MAGVALRTVPNVEIMHAGIEYNLSTGPKTFTPEMLRDVVTAANEDSSIPSPRLKIGHVDPRFNNEKIFDGSPSFGKATNLRLSDNGMAVYADYVGVPAWLAEIMATAYPSRSIEGWSNVESQMGKKWKFVLSACSVLGVTWPGITVLEDLPSYYGEEMPPGIVIDEEAIAASHQPGGDPVKVNASANLDDVRRAFYNEYLPANQEARWWWIQAILVDPNELVLEDDESGQLYMLPFSSDDAGVISFDAATAVRIDYIPDDRESMKAAATHVAATLAIGRQVLASWPTRAESRPDNSGGAMDPKEVRKQLGLPEDASEEQVHSALLVKAGLTVVEGGGEGGEPVVPVAVPPVAVVVPPAPVPTQETKTAEELEAERVAASSGFNLPPGTVLMDEGAVAEIRAGLAIAQELKSENDKNKCTTVVKAALGEGKIPPSREQFWLDYAVRDLEGATQVLASMPANLIPVHERGHGHPRDEGGGDPQLEAEVVSGWTEQLFKEVRVQNAQDRAAASGEPVRRTRITADANFRR